MIMSVYQFIVSAMTRWRNNRHTVVIVFFAFISHEIYADSKVNLDSPTPLRFPVSKQQLQLINTGEVNASLGGYDISDILTIDDDAIYFNHSGSVPPGNYLAKIEVVQEDGTIELIYEQQLTLYRELWKTSAELTTTASYKLNAKQRSDFMARVERLSESALHLQAKKLGENVHVTTQLNLQHRSDTNSLTGEKLEIPKFYIGIEKQTKLGNLGFALGNQTIESNGLVFNGFNRRGISAKFNDQKGRYGLKAFSMNTEPSVSSRTNFIANQKESRSSGLTFDFLPFATDETQISLQGGYIDGRSTLEGTGIAFNYDLSAENDVPLSYGGTTWFIATNSHWFEESLGLQIEHAESQIDSDGFGFGEPAQGDKANRYRIAINNQGKFKDWLSIINPSSWAFFVQRQTVGANFYSMANIGLAGDIQNTQSSMQLSWTEVQLQISSLEVQNNISNNETLPTQTSRQNQAQLNYNPDVSLEKSIWAIIGRPIFTLQLSKTNRSQDIEDAHLLGADIDDSTRETSLSVAFQREKLSWSVQHTRNEFSNRALAETPDGVILALPRSSANNQFTSIMINYNPIEKLSISPTLQKSNYKELDTQNSQSSLNLGLQASMSFLEDTLKVHLSHNSSKQDSSFGAELLTQSYQGKQSSITLSWLAKKAKNHAPGLQISFNSIWNETKASSQEVDDNYQLQLNLEVYWAAGEK